MNKPSHFDVLQRGFYLTPDPRYLFLSGAHRKAQQALVDAVDRRQGFTVLTAAPGLGKTTLLLNFLETISSRARTVFLFFTQCDSAEVLRYIARDLGLEPSSDITQLHKDLVDIMIAEARAGRTVVLVVDEAHHLSTDALEAIRLLTNFETTLAKLLQVILVGQPSLLDKLDTPELVQVRQRIVSFSSLAPLSKEDCHSYVQHRLTLAAEDRASAFSVAALDHIASASNGIPRVINNICSLALRYADADGDLVNIDAVMKATAELKLDNTQPKPNQISSPLHAGMHSSSMAPNPVPNNMPNSASSTIGSLHTASKYSGTTTWGRVPQSPVPPPPSTPCSVELPTSFTPPPPPTIPEPRSKQVIELPYRPRHGSLIGFSLAAASELQGSNKPESSTRAERFQMRYAK
jgi:general secretion pathway protein A